jgi:hypothetical protein
MLPEYRESLHVRYPPVCDNCMPAVEEEIKKKDSMARSQALGGWLKETKGKTTERRVSQTLQHRERVSKELTIWRIRGCLWCLTVCVALFGNLTGVTTRCPHGVKSLANMLAVALNKSLFSSFVSLPPILPLIALISILWTAWDPTYASVSKARIQGREVRVQGKQKYNVSCPLFQTRVIFTDLATVSSDDGLVV